MGANFSRHMILLLIGFYFLQTFAFGTQDGVASPEAKRKKADGEDKVVETCKTLVTIPGLTAAPELKCEVVASATGLKEQENEMSPLKKLKNMRIMGHRGGSFGAPENTRSSLLEAFALGAAGAEFDLQMTKDNEVIILHDETMERTAGPFDAVKFPHHTAESYQRLIKTPVQELTFDQIKEIDIGHWKDPKWQGEKLITFKESLEILPPGREYLVEVKGDDFAIIPHLKKILLDSKVVPAAINLIGFGLPVMEEIKRQLPQFKVYYIVDHDQVDTPEKMEMEISKMVKAGVDGMDFRAEGNVTKAVVDRIKKENKMVAVWVPGAPKNPLDTSENVLKMDENGVDIFTSNLPPWVAGPFLKPTK